MQAYLYDKIQGLDNYSRVSSIGDRLVRIVAYDRPDTPQDFRHTNAA